MPQQGWPNFGRRSPPQVADFSTPPHNVARDLKRHHLIVLPKQSTSAATTICQPMQTDDTKPFELVVVLAPATNFQAEAISQ